MPDERIGAAAGREELETLFRLLDKLAAALEAGAAATRQGRDFWMRAARFISNEKENKTTMLKLKRYLKPLPGAALQPRWKFIRAGDAGAHPCPTT